MTHWHRAFRDRVNIEIDDFRGVPLPMVQRAVRAKEQDAREEKRGRGRAHDQIWWVFDCDDHPSIPEALDLAGRSGIYIAFSNPCLELWFLLHFQDQAAYIDPRSAQRIAADHLGVAKIPTESALSELFSLYTDAKERAMRLDRKHEGDGSPRDSNPSSGVWRLVDVIRSA